MTGDHADRNDAVGVDELMGGTAFMIIENGHCLYDPSATSAIRSTVPYGTELRIIRREGEWVQVIAFGKKAWSPREHLAEQLEAPRTGIDVGVRPTSFLAQPGAMRIEHGPRGGRFVRTSSGFKRYL